MGLFLQAGGVVAVEALLALVATSVVGGILKKK
jgi:hypothetical protein